MYLTSFNECLYINCVYWCSHTLGFDILSCCLQAKYFMLGYARNQTCRPIVVRSAAIICCGNPECKSLMFLSTIPNLSYVKYRKKMMISTKNLLDFFSFLARKKTNYTDDFLKINV